MDLNLEPPQSTETCLKRITAIEPSRPDGNQVVIKVNGKKTAIVSAKSVAQLGLFVDQPWDNQLAGMVTEAALYDKALNAALTMLNRRPRSIQKLAMKLRQKGHATAVINRVTNRLVELNILNDYTFGQTLIRDAQVKKPAGTRLLRSKLLEHGIADQTIDQLIEEATMPHDETVEQAKKLVFKTLRTTRRAQEPHVIKRRLWSMLARRGFSADIIEASLQEVKNSGGEVETYE